MTGTDANSGKSPRIFGLIIAIGLFILDQAIKYWVAGLLMLKERFQIEILPIFNLTWAENRGVSMGFLTASSDTQRWLLVGLTSVIAFAVFIWMWREKGRNDVLALAMILGGALGNIVDRIRLGFVIDYADLHFGAWRPFLIFNLADAAITIGVLLLLAQMMFFSKKDEQVSSHS